jgi:hypothetical protein
MAVPLCCITKFQNHKSTSIQVSTYQLDYTTLYRLAQARSGRLANLNGSKPTVGCNEDLSVKSETQHHHRGQPISDEAVRFGGLQNFGRF